VLVCLRRKDHAFLFVSADVGDDLENGSEGLFCAGVAPESMHSAGWKGEYYRLSACTLRRHQESACMVPPKILVADDEPSLRRLCNDILTDHGYTVVEAADGVEAIATLKSQHLDAILLDINMPRVDGWGVLEFVRTMDVPPAVVLVTGMDEIVPPGHLNQYVSGVVSKPFAITQLLKTLELARSRPALIPALGPRGSVRRTFVVETTLLSEAGHPLAIGQLQEISAGGFRVEFSLRLQEGDPVRLVFQLPGRLQPVELRGRVRWHQGDAVGAEIEQVSDGDAAVLRDLIGG
jgi:CheY-like chemotaxis protein